MSAFCGGSFAASVVAKTDGCEDSLNVTDPSFCATAPPSPSPPLPPSPPSPPPSPAPPTPNGYTLSLATDAGGNDMQGRSDGLTMLQCAALCDARHPCTHYVVDDPALTGPGACWIKWGEPGSYRM